MKRPKPLILAILDGFGVSRESQGNPVAEARHPTIDSIEKFFPFMVLQASGPAVGLPYHEAGNSEVGHLTMGSGRVIYHHLPRIINAIRNGDFFENEALKRAADLSRERKSSFHVAGLVSSGSVHSYFDHLEALLEFTKKEKLERVFMHIFTDGRDAPPHEGKSFMPAFEERLFRDWPNVTPATMQGRFYAMNRSGEWERTRAAYELLTQGVGVGITSSGEYLSASYEKNKEDEFVEPAFFAGDGNVPRGLVGPDDALVFFNFREDSMRQITHAFTDAEFSHFSRPIKPAIVVTMTEYDKNIAAVSAFPSLDIANPLSRVLTDEGISHLHIAESEKYAHVTYFFNGGIEEPFEREERILVPSVPVTDYGDYPQMQAAEVALQTIDNCNSYDVTIVNFANADMVGHSGNFKAAIAAVEVLDEVIAKLVALTMNGDGVLVITGDHGNVELKRDLRTGRKLTEHSVNPVPLYLIGKDYKRKTERGEYEIGKIKEKPGGILTDVAPTILELLGVHKPKEMTGTSLVSELLRQVK